MSRHQATKQYRGKELVEDLQKQGILIRSILSRCGRGSSPSVQKY